MPERHRGRAGLAGWSDAETVHDDRVWLVKTHSRFETADQGGAFAQFEAQRAILLVRHPLKVVTSFWHFVLANERQDRSVPASTFTTFSRIWDVFISRVGPRGAPSIDFG